MKKKAVRAITGLLCAAMVFSHMAGMRVYAMEGGTGQEAQMQESVSGNNDAGGETEGAEQPKDTGEQGDPAVSEDMEDFDDQEDNEEAGAEGTEEKTPDSENPDKEKNPEEPPEGETDKEGDENEVGEDEPAGEKEPTEETEAEETAEEGMMLFSARAAESEAVQDADSTYTDENGVIYHYYGYDDGTAEIYELEDCKESTWDYKALNIPSRIGDYTVTSLTFSLPSETPTFPSVTIPETVTYMKDSLFKRMKISELYYNAEAAETGAGGDSTGVFF